MTDEFAAVSTRVSIWRRLITWGLFFLFLFLFRYDLIPAARGFWNLTKILWEHGTYLMNDTTRQQAMQAVGFTNAMLTSMARVLVNIFVFAFIYFLSMFMMAQFALPVQGWQNRWNAFWRLFYYWLGWYGLTAFVREGKLIAKTGEQDSLNAGVILVDLSSAVVLTSQPWEEETASNSRIPEIVAHQNEKSPLIRVVGPGVNFIEAGEKIKTIIDLRKQVRTTPGVKASTRDGIELETSIFTVFSVGEPADDILVAYIGGNEQKHLRVITLSEEQNKKTHIQQIFYLDPLDAEEIHQAVLNGRIGAPTPAGSISELNKTIHPYLFDSQRVFAAFTAEALNNSHLYHNTKWHELTQPICVDLFQSMLSTFTYDQIFSLSGLTETYLSDEGNAAGMKKKEENAEFLKTFKAELSFKMRCMGMISYRLVKIKSDVDEQVSGRVEWMNSLLNEDNCREDRLAASFYKSDPQPLTASKVIRDHGIKVIAAGFTQILSQAEIRRQIVETWKARSEREINITLAKYERDAMQVINNARTQVQRDNAYHLSNLFKEQKHSKEALALFLFQSLENIATDPKSHGDLPPREVLGMLQNLHRWLLIERKDMELKNQRSSGHSSGGEKPEGQSKP